MRSSRLLQSVILTIACSVGLAALSAIFFPQSASAIVVELSVDELTLLSDVIVVGTVTDVASFRQDSGIYTDVTVSVEQTVKGEPPGTEITVRQMGGRVCEEWVARYNSPGNGYEGAYAMAVDAAGIPAQDARLVAPLQQYVYLEGRIAEGVECGCQFLQAFDSRRYNLIGDLEGFTCGDQVAVWGTVCTGCVSDCMEEEHAIILVEDIAQLPPTPTPTPAVLDPPVGGVAALPDVSGTSPPPYAALAGGLAAALLALTAGGWYARRRRLR